MNYDFIPPPPPPPLPPESVRHLTPGERIVLWGKMVDDYDRQVLASIRECIGPDGDAEAEFARWLEQQYEEHDRALYKMLSEISRRERECQARRKADEKAAQSA